MMCKKIARHRTTTANHRRPRPQQLRTVVHDQGRWKLCVGRLSVVVRQPRMPAWIICIWVRVIKHLVIKYDCDADNKIIFEYY